MSTFGIGASNPWVRVLDALEKKVNRTSYETWLKPTRYDHAQGPILLFAFRILSSATSANATAI